MRREPRVLIYAAGVAGVGQTRRAMRLAEYVCSVLDTTAVLVASGVPAGAQLLGGEQSQVVSLSAVVDLVRAVRQQRRPGAVAGPAAAATSELLSVASEFDPDVFVTTTHAGLARELQPLLKRLGDQGCRRILALRDVYWPPRFVREFQRLSTRDFDGVLVGGPPQTSSWIPAGLLEGALANRLWFVGYLRPIEEAPLPGTASPLVHCQVGSGRDGYTLAAAVVKVVSMLRAQQPAVRLHVSTGPLMAEDDRRRLFASSDAANIVVEPWIMDPFGSTATHPRPAVVVSMAGYNSCVEAAWFGTPTILCPRRQADDKEQEIRAHLFADRFDNITVVDRSDPDVLLAAVCEPPIWRTERLKEAQLADFAEPRHVAGLVLTGTS